MAKILSLNFVLKKPQIYADNHGWWFSKKCRIENKKSPQSHRGHRGK